MAYISQERKAKIVPAIKAVMKEFGFAPRDFSVAVDNGSSLVVNIWKGPIDFIGIANEENRELAERRGDRYYEIDGNYQVNPYYAADSKNITGKFFGKLVAAMKSDGWYDNSDVMTDYFDVDYYIDINVGRWNRPYVLTV